MEKLKSSMTNMVLVLTGVAVITGCILAYVNHITSGPIEVQKAKTLADGIKSVMGSDESPSSFGSWFSPFSSEVNSS